MTPGTSQLEGVYYHQKVDHVPYGLAAFAGYVSKIGYLMTEQVEKIFTLPDDLKYQKTGHLSASTLIQQARTFHITNDAMAENIPLPTEITDVQASTSLTNKSFKGLGDL